MSARSPFEPELEPERYELREGLPYRFELGRRGFLHLLGGVVVLVAAHAAASQESGRGGQRPTATPRASSPRGFTSPRTGRVTVFTGKVEVGQNARTSLAQAVADELHAPLDSIRLVMGDTDLTPLRRGHLRQPIDAVHGPAAPQGRGRRRASCSRSSRRRSGASTAASLVVADGKVTHTASGRSLGFGALTKGQKLVRTLLGEIALTPAERWTVAGRSAPKVNARDIVTGRHRYTSDLSPAPFAPSELLYGRVLRPPAIGATLASLEPIDAEDACAASCSSPTAISSASRRSALRRPRAPSRPCGRSGT